MAIFAFFIYICTSYRSFLIVSAIWRVLLCWQVICAVEATQSDQHLSANFILSIFRTYLMKKKEKRNLILLETNFLRTILKNVVSFTPFLYSFWIVLYVLPKYHVSRLQPRDCRWQTWYVAKTDTFRIDIRIKIFIS